MNFFGSIRTIVNGSVFAVFLLWPVVTLASFSDVTSNHQYFEAIRFVQNENLFEGYSDGSFRPDQTINRAELLKVIIESQFDSEEINICPSQFAGKISLQELSDVKRDTWFVPYLCKALTAGIVDGYSDKTFRPNQPISFAEAAKIIARAFFELETVPNDPSYYPGDVEPWYRRDVKILEDRFAIPLSVKGFGVPITRGEFAEILFRLKGNTVTQPSNTYVGLGGSNPTALQEFLKEPDKIFHLSLVLGRLGKHVPPEIGNFTNLTSLELWQNTLQDLPPAIGKLQKLKAINAYGNEITYLPPEFFRLTALEWVGLHDNNLSSLPSDIRFLRNLTVLNVGTNRLRVIPSEIGKLKKLKRLVLNDNQLTEIPSTIGNLFALEYLDLSGNKITTLPPEMSKLRNLSYLSLDGNNFSEAEKTRIKNMLPAGVEVKF